jgi:hypothetical protein
MLDIARQIFRHPVGNILKAFGREIRPIVPYPIPADIEPEIVAAILRVKDFTYTSPERMAALYESVRYICRHHIPGAFVECGVWRGGSAMLCALALLSLGQTDRKIYLYDTFDGMSEPDEIDVESLTGKAARPTWEAMRTPEHNDWAYASLEEVQSNLLSTGYPTENIVYVKGKVENTLPATLPDTIALLRLDTDWYQSTYHELQHLYPRLAELGVLLIDDYGHWQGAHQAVDQFLAENGIPILLNRVDYTGRIGIKPPSGLVRSSC